MNNNDRLLAKSHSLGLSPEFVQGLISRFGPMVAELLLQLLESKLSLTAAKPYLLNDTTGLVWLENLLVKFLTTHTQQVETWVLSGEQVVIDAIVAAIASKNTVLAAVLKGLEGKLVTTQKELTEQAIADLIALLTPKS